MNAGGPGVHRPYGGPVPVPADAAAAPGQPAALRPARALPAGWAAPAAGVAAWAGAIAAARAILGPLRDADFRIHIGNPPLAGTLDWHPSWRLAGAVAIAAATVAAGPALAVRLPWRGLLASVYGLAAAWPLLLAAADGPDAVSAPLESRYEYLHDLPRVGSPGAFLRTFTERLPEFATHTKGHPPGFLLGAWALDQAGLGGSRPLAIAVILLGALAAPAALVAARALAGPGPARAAAPFAALAPAALWIATSADAAYLGVSAAGIAAFAVACAASGRRAALAAGAAGLVLGAALLGSYGVAPLGLIVVTIAVATRRLRLLAVAGAGTAAVLGAAALAGFWWLDGLAATRDLYAAGIASRRPSGVFLLVNVAAFAVAAGPAAAAGLAALRDRRMWWLCGSAAAAVALADLSGLSRGETERIWLPFVPWILLATAALAGAGGRPRRGWLAAQAGVALVLAAATRSPW